MIVIVLGVYLIPKVFLGYSIWPVNKEVVSTSKPAIVTKENFPSFLSNQPIVLDLPATSEIELKIFEFKNGIKQYEDSYVIKKGSVVKGEAKNPDFIIFLDSKYIPELGDFCTALKKAIDNKEILYEQKISSFMMISKYSYMAKYKQCF